MPQVSAACFARPIRADHLARAGVKLRFLLAEAGASRPDAAALGRGVVATARHTRTYLDGTRDLLRARNAGSAAKSLERIQRVIESLRRTVGEMAPALDRVIVIAGDGEDAAALAEVWFQGGGPQELAAEGKMRQALSARLSALGPVRVSDLAHLACLWSDSQRFHAALRGVLESRGQAGHAAFLEAVSGCLRDHILPVDLLGLPGDPGLLQGIPAMISRLRAGRASRKR